MRMVFLLVVAGWLGTGGVEAAGLRVLSAQPDEGWNRLFQRTNGWLGADAIYSVSLGAERRLWFFGDTFVGRVVDGRRTNVVMINNSVGVQAGKEEAGAVEFFYRKQGDGRAGSWLEPVDGRGWLWPFGGVGEGGKAWVFLWQMEKTGGGGAFAFRNVAVWLARIENAAAAPGEWRVTQVRVPFTELGAERRRLFGSAVLRAGEWVYVYGIEEPVVWNSGGRRMLIARVPAGRVEDFGAWSFWGWEGWSGEFAKVRGVGGGMGTEYSVSYVASVGAYVAVTTSNGLSDVIVADSAPEPWGPWTGKWGVYKCPEGGLTRQTFCYAGKAHGWAGADGELLVSYAFNSHDFWEVVRDARLYWPRFVRVKVGEMR